ncbi:MAG: nucleoside-diphosphate sugar epimerase [Fibrobacteres bacterium]|nr:nucleoside-diphosphate sugar epimerase [Fibrobacterota bacterium]
MINLKGKRVLLVGGAGFIGHHLAISLKKRGVEVEIMDSLQVNNLCAFQNSAMDIPNRDRYVGILNERLELLRRAGIPVHVQDARDYHGLSQLVAKFKPNALIHLAAISHAGKSNKDPYSTFDHNLRTLENALDACRDTVEHFIFFSSSMVYGNFPNGFASEDTPCNPIGIYGALKFAGEKMVIAYNQVFNLPYTIVRPSALYGERCVSRRVGQIFIESAMDGLEINVNGKGSDGLDFTYVEDLVGGVVNVLENEKSKNEIFNLTFGQSRSLTEMIGILSENFPDVKVNYLPKDVLMPDRGTLDISKARRLIGYNPKNPLEKGYLRYINWYKESMANPDWSFGGKITKHAFVPTGT